MSTDMLIGPAEKLAALQEDRRTRLLKLADYLTSLDDYPDPWHLFTCDGVPAAVTEEWTSELLRITVRAERDEHWMNVVLDYLTGVC